LNRPAAVWRVHQGFHNGAGGAGRRAVLCGAIFLAVLAVAFVGMGATVLAVVQGTPTSGVHSTGGFTPPARLGDRASTAVPILLFMGLVLMLGVYIPPPLESLLREAAALVAPMG